MASEDQRPCVSIAPDGGERLDRGEGRFHRVLCELDELEIIEMQFGPDFEGVPPHTHDNQVDSFYVLEGLAEFTVEGETFTAGPGSYVAAPRGVEHGFANAGEGELRLLNIHSPNTGFVGRIR